MTDAPAPPPTISNSFIFLKTKGFMNVPTKKVMFPQTLNLLKKTATNIFKDMFEVHSLYDENGSIIKDIKQVVPGSTIYVSSLPEGDEDFAYVKKPKQSPAKKPIMSKESYNRLFGANDNKDIQPQDEDDNELVKLYDNESNQETPNKRIRYTPKSERIKKQQEDETKKKKNSKIPSRTSTINSTGPHTNQDETLAKKGIPTSYDEPYAQDDSQVSSSVKSTSGRDFSPEQNFQDDDEDDDISLEEEIPKKPKRKLSSKPYSKIPPPNPKTPQREETLKFPTPASKKKTPSKDQSYNKEIDDDYSFEQDDQFDLNDENMDDNIMNSASRASTTSASFASTPGQRKKKSQIPTNKSPSGRSSVMKSPIGSEISAQSAARSNKSETRSKTKVQTIKPRNKVPSVTNESRSQTQASEAHSKAPSVTNESRSQASETHSKAPSVINESRSQVSEQHSKAPSVSSTGSKKLKLTLNPTKSANESSSIASVVEENDNKSEDIDSDEEVEEDNKDLQKVFDEAVEPGTLQGVLQEALELIPDYVDSLRTIPKLEKEQMLYWYQKGIQIAEQQNISQLPKDSHGVDEMIGKARVLLMDHRFPKLSGTSHRLNIGIIGPQQSGKTALMRVFFEELLADLASTGEWKTTFIFTLDMCNIASYSSNFLQFYKAFLDITFQCIAWQFPSLIQHIPYLQKTFEDVTIYDGAPKLLKTFMINPETQRFAPELQTILNKLSINWNDESALNEWITSVIYLPILISRALGMKKCIYIFDHYDLADMILQPSPGKFAESESQVSLIDVINYALVHCNFVVACSSQHDFLQSIEKTPDDEIPKAHFELVSTIGLLRERTYTDKRIKVKFNDDTFPIVLTCEVSGGVPLYQHVWDNINTLLDEIDKNKGNEEEEEDEEKVDQLNTELINQVQTAMKYWYTDEDEEQRFHEVVSVTRTTSQE